MIKLNNADLNIDVVVGSTTKTINELQELDENSIIELNTSNSDPSKIYAGGQLVGEGEIVVVDEQMGIRVTKIYE